MTMRLRQIIAPIATLLLASCGGSTEDPAPDPTVASVSVTSATGSVAPGGTLQMTAVAKNAGGTTLTGQTATWSSSATGTATVDGSGLVTGVANGTATITATIAGIPGSKGITVETITGVAAANVTADNTNTFNPNHVDLSAGGTVTWQFNTANDHNVTFQGSAAGTPANIPNQKTGNFPRTFTTAGTFTYTCTNHIGMSGTIVVH